MPSAHEIRADYDQDTIVVYQAFSPVIADAVLAAGRFVAPFSFQRMTWIKPSFLWLMHRSNWAQQSGQQRVLAVRIRRTGWDRALELGLLTAHDPVVFPTAIDWQTRFRRALVHVQWDPERSLRGVALPYSSIQVGLSRHVIREYAERWVVAMEDLTPRVRKIYHLLQSGEARKAQWLLPAERRYPVSPEIGHRLRIEPAGTR
jgi:hypothetical protein